MTKVVTGENTDYVFLSTTPLTFTREGVEFAGLAGAVSVGKDGKATLILSAGPGKVGYQGHVISSAVPFEKIVSAGNKTETIPALAWAIKTPVAPANLVVFPEKHLQKVGVTKARTTDGTTTRYTVNAIAALDIADGNVRLYACNATVVIDKANIRFVVPERAYAQLSVGAVGVRGVGPFDLTFTPDGITGKVDGDIRTLVTTWPEKITRPGYYMDSIRWYAGFADEHSISKGTTTPQFSLAFGVSSGEHTVKINEWEWPAMPPAPVRAMLSKL